VVKKIRRNIGSMMKTCGEQWKIRRNIGSKMRTCGEEDKEEYRIKDEDLW